MLSEELALATPPPHPSDSPAVPPNPLATVTQPATIGTRVSLVSIDDRPPPLSLWPALSVTTLSLTGTSHSIQEHPNEGRVSDEDARSSSDAATSSASDAAVVKSPISCNPAPAVVAVAVAVPVPVSGPTSGLAPAPAFGEGTALLAVQNGSRDAGKKRKPKNNILKSSSSFLSRVIINEQLSRRLQAHPSDGFFAFTNIGRAFQWLDLSSPSKVCVFDVA